MTSILCIAPTYFTEEIDWKSWETISWKTSVTGGVDALEYHFKWYMYFLYKNPWNTLTSRTNFRTEPLDETFRLLDSWSQCWTAASRLQLQPIMSVRTCGGVVLLCGRSNFVFRWWPLEALPDLVALARKYESYARFTKRVTPENVMNPNKTGLRLEADFCCRSLGLEPVLLY